MMNASKIVIWGVGRYGKKLYFEGGAARDNLEIVAYTDSNPEKWGGFINNIPIVPPAQLVKLEYDYIYFTVNHPAAFENVLVLARENKIDTNRIVDVITDPTYLELFMDSRYTFIRDYSRMIYESDIKGSVAECGVYRGESAKFINYYFPDRRFYLFDTFEGFAEKDIVEEKKLGNAGFNNSVWAQSSTFNDTNVQYVLKKFKYPDNAIIKKGYFPNSADGIDDCFVFVNLDMDLYIPMLAGLKFFWTKLVHGGVHFTA